MSRTLHLFGTDWCAMMVPIQVIRWYRMQCYDGTDSCATVVPIRRYSHSKRVINLLRHFFYGCYGIEATTAIPVQLSDTFNYELEQTPWRQEMQYGKFSQGPKVARKAVKILMEKSQYCRAGNTDIYYHIPGNDGIFRDADYCSHNVSAERSKQQRDKPLIK